MNIKLKFKMQDEFCLCFQAGDVDLTNSVLSCSCQTERGRRRTKKFFVWCEFEADHRLTHTCSTPPNPPIHPPNVFTASSLSLLIPSPHPSLYPIFRLHASYLPPPSSTSRHPSQYPHPPLMDIPTHSLTLIASLPNSTLSTHITFWAM